MKENTRKENKGITLIALVVTIVVLLILAGVSIAMLTGENGIITQAQEAKVEMTHSDVTERIKLEYANYQLEKQTPDNTDPGTFWQFIFYKNYIDNEGRVDTQTLSGQTLSLGNGTGTTDVYKIEENDGKYELKYYENATNLRELWEVAVENTNSSQQPISELKEGDYVIYKDKNGNEIRCIVLYDNTSDYGIQIITENCIEDVTLGGDTLEDVKNSYNSAIETLNGRAAQYLNTDYASSARSVGSKPAEPSNENETLYTSTNAYLLEYSGLFEIGEEANATTDAQQLKKLTIYQSNKNYWMAARKVYDEQEWISEIGQYGEYQFYARILGNAQSEWQETSNVYLIDAGTIEGERTRGLRPVFTLKEGLTIAEGNGSEEQPYKLNK